MVFKSQIYDRSKLFCRHYKIKIMCGIAGYINFNKRNLNFDRKKLLSLMNSRGPDDNGIFNEKERDFNLSLFHSRLTILDDNQDHLSLTNLKIMYSLSMEKFIILMKLKKAYFIRI